MQIIIMHSRFTQARSLTLGTPHIVVAVLAFVLLTLLTGVLMAALSMRLASADVPLFRSLLPLPAAMASDAGGKDRYLQENLSAMAAKLGEMEAHLIRLDALGERCRDWPASSRKSFSSVKRRGVADGNQSRTLI
jgi:hypothetical protein